MRFNVSQFLLEDPGSTRHYEFDEPPGLIDEGVDVADGIVGDVRLSRTNRGILADARARMAVRLQCSRCLEEILQPVRVAFIEEYYPTVDLRTGLPVKVPEGGTGFMLTENHELDLTEPIRQYVLLEIPMKPLCRIDCAGLCPMCGQDLNRGTCNCKDEDVDPRLGQLAEWLRANRQN